MRAFNIKAVTKMNFNCGKAEVSFWVWMLNQCHLVVSRVGFLVGFFLFVLVNLFSKLFFIFGFVLWS